ncbi:MAG TPA: NAD(P)H-dependent oxidoreductase [Acetivibrio clariflavus]|nr:NAD(P)H-dependent oxidoreductase [Acetivibrio clariflavus]HPU41046.1 NAD(P)H-dependent oxidoreductase [Acetivibrio clariflavus]
MKIVVINGTEVKGCTYRIKEIFLSVLKKGNEIIEFYLPKDMPHFCIGCKTCFFKSENLCPHAEYVMPIWNEILKADLLVFAAPVYALSIPAQMKALLDHLCCHWMVHRPEKAMFTKCAVILTNSIGASNRKAQKDIATSLKWLGVSDVSCLGFGLMEGVVWEKLSDKRKNKIKRKVESHAKKFVLFKPGRKRLTVKVLFFICKMIHIGLLKKEEIPSADNQHWIDNGWIKDKV